MFRRIKHVTSVGVGLPVGHAVYTHKGNEHNVRDDRGMWNIAFSMAVSDMGSIAAGDMGDVGDMLDTVGDNFLDPERAFDADYVQAGCGSSPRRRTLRRHALLERFQSRLSFPAFGV